MDGSGQVASCDLPASPDSRERCCALYERGPWRIGVGRCPPDRPEFHDPGHVARHSLLFPLTSVRLHRPGVRPFTADPTQVTFYNRGDEVQREALTPLGDRYLCLHVDEDSLREQLRPFDPSVEERCDRPFRLPRASVGSPTVLMARSLLAYLKESPQPDALFVEEAATHLLERVFTEAHESSRRGGAKSDRGRTRRDDLVEEARARLALEPGRSWSLGELSAAVDASPSHLCRVFTQVSGENLSTYRNRLRLSAALDRALRGECDLKTVATGVGFSSHSHMTFEFRRQFGLPPSTVRDWIQRGRFPRRWRAFAESQRRASAADRTPDRRR